MSLLSDIRISDFSLEFVPIETRVPLKFGTETLSSVTCSRVKVVVENRKGQKAEGWGDPPQRSVGLAFGYKLFRETPSIDGFFHSPDSSMAGS